MRGYYLGLLRMMYLEVEFLWNYEMVDRQGTAYKVAKSTCTC